MIPIRGSASGEGDDGLYISCSVNGKPVKFLVDTGASVTMLKHSVYNELSEDQRIILDKENRVMQLADGRTLPFRGKGDFSIKIDTYETMHNILVADIEVDGILGMDFLGTHQCELLRTKNGYALSLSGTRVPCHSSRDGLACLRIALCETVVLPPRSESIVTAHFVDGEATEELGVIEATGQFQERHNLMMARSLVHLNWNQVPLRLLNPTDSTKTVYKDSIAATCEPAQCIDEDNRLGVNCVKPQAVDSEASLETIPDHLTDVYTRSCKELDEKQQRDVSSLLKEFSDVFSSSPEDIGRTNIVTHRINTGDSLPIKQQARRLPLHKRQEAQKEVTKMLDRGIIEPSCSPWASPIVLVKKPDGSTRFCLDYRKLNAVTVKDSYPLPRIDDTLDALVGSRWFSTLDLSSGYWQVEVAEEDRPKTAFTTGAGGLYQFKVMPFGLCNAPATFERLMEQILLGLPWEILLIYLDDVIVYAKTFEEMLARLRTVLSRLRDAQLKLSPKKCSLFQSEVKYLGHVISHEGVSTDPLKIAAISDWPVPTNIRDLRSFLGLCSYYRRFVRGFAELAKPLYKLQEKGASYVWSEDCERSFARLKKCLTATPILAFPSVDNEFILDTDASNSGVGAVLSQVSSGEEKVVAYYSRTLSKSERNYCVTRRELLAAILAIRNFHHYLLGRRFRIRTDHGALQWLMDFRNPDGQMARWLEELSMYEFEIEFRKGRFHGNADGLSRRPCGECRKCSKEEAGGERRDKDEALPCNSVKESHPSETPAVWIQQWSMKDLCKEQRADDSIGTIIELKEKNESRPNWCDISSKSSSVKSYWAQWDRLILKDSILYRQWESETGDISLQLVLPPPYRQEVLTQLHNTPTAGHLGSKKTFERVKDRFYWTGYSQDVRRWCQCCDTCSKRAGPPKEA